MNPAIGSIDTSGLPHEWKGIIATTPIKESSFEPYKRKRAEPPLSHTHVLIMNLQLFIMTFSIVLFCYSETKNRKEKNTLAFYSFDNVEMKLVFMFECLIIQK